jgi:hypothetical protein
MKKIKALMVGLLIIMSILFVYENIYSDSIVIKFETGKGRTATYLKNDGTFYTTCSNDSDIKCDFKGTFPVSQQ